MRLGIIGIALLALAFVACGNPIKADEADPTKAVDTPTPSATATNEPTKTPNGPSLPPPKSGEGTGTEAWTPAQKCQWLRENFPQTTSGVQALGAKLASASAARIRTNIYRCDPKTNESVFDGLIVLGPNEGWSGMVTVKVPEHGAVDAYDPSCGAKYTGEHHEVAGGFPNKCDDTWRASSGEVTALSVTVYAWNDDNPPIGGSRVDNKDSARDESVCITGKQLAEQRGWGLFDPQPESVTKYGGAQVEVKSESTLPPGWEATTNGPKLSGGDLLTPGFYSVYPPNDGKCRQQLGVES